eukprot:PhM_4_TR9840/c0_g1_i1/m.86140
MARTFTRFPRSHGYPTRVITVLIGVTLLWYVATSRHRYAVPHVDTPMNPSESATSKTIRKQYPPSQPRPLQRSALTNSLRLVKQIQANARQLGLVCLEEEENKSIAANSVCDGPWLSESHVRNPARLYSVPQAAFASLVPPLVELIGSLLVSSKRRSILTPTKTVDVRVVDVNDRGCGLVLHRLASMFPVAGMGLFTNQKSVQIVSAQFGTTSKLNPSMAAFCHVSSPSSSNMSFISRYHWRSIDAIIDTSSVVNKPTCQELLARHDAVQKQLFGTISSSINNNGNTGGVYIRGVVSGLTQEDLVRCFIGSGASEDVITQNDHRDRAAHAIDVGNRATFWSDERRRVGLVPVQRLLARKPKRGMSGNTAIYNSTMQFFILVSDV